MILWDTGPLLASIDKDDERHFAAVKLMSATAKPFLVPSPVVVEVCYFLQQRVHPRAEVVFLRSITSGQLRLIHPEPGDVDRAAHLVEQYADFPLGYVDACVMAIAERMKVQRIATIDHRHFSAVRLDHCDGLELLP